MNNALPDEAAVTIEYTDDEIRRAVEAILFATGESVSYERLGVQFNMPPSQMKRSGFWSPSDFAPGAASCVKRRRTTSAIERGSSAPSIVFMRKWR